jgi:hypothetical protein
VSVATNDTKMGLTVPHLTRIEGTVKKEKKKEKQKQKNEKAAL